MATDRPVVVILPFAGPRVGKCRTPTRWKRAAVWANKERNRFIARIADGCVTGVRRTIRSHGSDASRLPSFGRDKRVVVLAETAAHARQMAGWLPGWVVLDAIPPAESGQGEERGENCSSNVIATVTYVAREGVECDLLVRATAGTGRLAASQFGPNLKLVVDVAEMTGDRRQADSQVRVREYRQQWRVLSPQTARETA